MQFNVFTKNINNLLQTKISVSDNSKFAQGVFAGYWVIAIALLLYGIMGAMVMFVWKAPAGDYISQWPGFGWFRAIEDHYQISPDYTGWIVEKRLHRLVLWLIILYFAAFFIGILPKFERRPLRPVLLIHLAMGLFMGGAAAGGIKYIVDASMNADLLASMAAVFTIMLVPVFYIVIGFLLEHLFVKILTFVSEHLYHHEMYHLADLTLALALRLRPTDKRLHRTLGLSLYADENYLEAVKNLEPLFIDNQQDIEVLEALDKCYLENGLQEKALDVEKHLLELQPERHATRLNAACILDSIGKTESALELLSQGPGGLDIRTLRLRLDFELKLDDHEAALSTAHALQSLDEGSERRTIQAYEDILQRWPDCEDTLERLGELYIAHKREEDGYALLERLLKTERYRQDLRQRLVKYYRRESRLKEAEPHVVALIDNGQYTKDVVLLYGDYLVKHKAFDDALMHFQYAIEIYPDDFRFPYYLSKIFFRLGVIDEARRCAEDAQAKVPAAQQAGQLRVKRLMRHIEEHLSLKELELWRDRCYRQPNNIESHLGYISALTTKGDYEQAVSESRILLEKHPGALKRLITCIEKLAIHLRHARHLLAFLVELKMQNRQYDEAFGLAKRMADSCDDKTSVMVEYSTRILERNPLHQHSLQYMLGVAQSREQWNKVFEYSECLANIDTHNQIRYRKLMLASAIKLDRAEETLALAKALYGQTADGKELFQRLIQYLIDKDFLEDAHNLLRSAEVDHFKQPIIRRLRQEINTRMQNQRLAGMG